MTRPLLKICGLMRAADVALCCRLGVDICGFVTEYPLPVPWNLTREQTAALLPLVRGRAKRCIVTGGPEEKIRELALALRPDFVQLHGGETIAVTAALVSALVDARGPKNAADAGLRAAPALFPAVSAFCHGKAD